MHQQAEVPSDQLTSRRRKNLFSLTTEHTQRPSVPETGLRATGTYVRSHARTYTRTHVHTTGLPVLHPTGTILLCLKRCPGRGRDDPHWG